MYALTVLAMLPRPQAGPFTRSVREALESVQSPDVATATIEEALEAAGLLAVPEEVESFRRFCERHLSKAVHRKLEQESVEQVFDRIGHVLWMATSDANAMETARAWGRAGMQWEDDSGVRHVDERARPAARAPSAPTFPAQIPVQPAPLQTPAAGVSVGRPQTPSTGVSVGRLRAADSRPRGATQELRAQGRDDRSASTPPPEGRPATAVLVITLDVGLVESVRGELGDHCPVRAITVPTEIAGAVLTSGPAPVVLIDTALPSIDLTTFAGIAPVLPPGARVVLWGLSPRQFQALAAKFPVSAGWLAPGSEQSPGRFLLELR